MVLLNRIAEDIKEIKSELKALREAIIPEENICEEEKKELLARLKEVEKGEYVDWDKARMELMNE